MISSEFDQSVSVGRIVLRPNRSCTWRVNAYIVATLMAISGSVGLLLAFRGIWLVLPFAAVEMTLLLACLYYCVRRTHLQEVLTFSVDYLDVQRGVRGPEIHERFQRYFTRFFVIEPRHPWYCKRISVCCQGTELEIGSFLSSEEKDDLVAALRSMIRRLDHRSTS